jgi:hypothetical protein
VTLGPTYVKRFTWRDKKSDDGVLINAKGTKEERSHRIIDSTSTGRPMMPNEQQEQQERHEEHAAAIATWDAFMAHSSVDTARVQALHRAIDPPFKVFLDDAERTAGDDYARVIAEAQAGSRMTIVCVSDAFNSSYYAREELATAIHLWQKKGGHRVVPVYFDRAPDQMEALPYGLRLLNGFVLARDGGITGVALRIAALLDEPSVCRPTEYATRIADLHPLAHYPRGPMVEARFIPRSVVEAYARLLRGNEAELVVEDANALRAQADAPESRPTFIRNIYLPDPRVVGPFDYWFGVFREAALNGPRMLAALLLVVPDDRFPEQAVNDRKTLLQRLQGGTS